MKYLSALILLAFSYLSIHAQEQKPQISGRGYYMSRIEIIDGDTLQVIDMMPIYKFKRPIDARRYEKLIRNVKKVYPIAKEAKAKLAHMEEELINLGSEKEQRAYMKKMEKEIKEEYTPVLKTMTLAQGKILIKLIDRETDRTSYALVRELRGGFSAFFWQGIAKIFGANLKDTYDKTGEDKMIEQIVILYEAGLI